MSSQYLNHIVRCISNAASNAIGHGKFYSRSHDAVIRVYNAAGNVIETHEHAGGFQEP
jgi:tryptophan synthase beta subunit